MNKYHFLLIGAGQLGSRHLQAMAGASSDFRLTVVDPSEESLSITKARYQEVDNVSQVRYLTDLSKVNDNVDVCVVATNAKYRLTVVNELVQQLNVKYLILEKVVFQSEQQLDYAAGLFVKKKISTWVNCPRRMFSIYKFLQKKLSGEDAISLKVVGHNWGLACNAIHFIDLWGFLSGSVNYSVDFSGLSNKIFESKRPGYKEVMGEISGSQGKSHFSLKCLAEDKEVSMGICIESTNYLIEISEQKGQCIITNRNTDEKETKAFKVAYQSELTGQVVDSLVSTGQCELAAYDESSSLHRPFINGLLEFFNNSHSENYVECPIT